MDSEMSSTTVSCDRDQKRCFISCTAWPALVTHYAIVAVNGGTTMRLGHVFNENVIYVVLWGHRWRGRTMAFIRPGNYSEDYATLSGDGSLVSVWGGTACSTVYQFTFSFYWYPAGTDSLAFTSASTVLVNPYCRCFSWVRASFTGQEVAFFCWFLFHIQKNLISCSTQASRAFLMGLMEAGGALDRICNGAEPPLILLELFRLHHRLPDNSKIRLVYQQMVHRFI